MKLTVCIGSSCHIKGSRQIVEIFRRLIVEKGLQDKIDLGGTFCMGKCAEGVCVSIDDNVHSVTVDSAEEFFNKEILTRV